MHTGFWRIILAVAIYGVIHSTLAAIRLKNWVKHWLGKERYDRYYRLFFSFQAGVLFFPILLLIVILPDHVLYHIPTPWLYLTISLQIAAVVGLFHSLLKTGLLRFVGISQALDPQQAKRPLSMVTGGLYRLVRHPLYLCTFAFIWLLPVMSMNILGLNIGISLYTLIGAWLEEQKLMVEFGQDYQAYRQRTPFIIPTLKIRKAE